MKARIVGFISVIFLVLSCGDANRGYVRKAVRIMDKHGIFAEGAEWPAPAKSSATTPFSLTSSPKHPWNLPWTG